MVAYIRSIFPFALVTLWATKASAEICILGFCIGGGGVGGGPAAAPEIDASSGIGAIALLASIGAIAYSRRKR